MDAYDRELLASRLTEKGLLDDFLDRVGVEMAGGLSVAEAWETVSTDYGGVPEPTDVSDEVIWSALSMASMDRKAAPRDEAEWVIRHHGVPIRRIDPDKVPSSGAVTMLRWSREVGLSEFMKTIYAKLMPSRSELEQESRFKQSGRVLAETLAEVGQAYEDSIVAAEFKRRKRDKKVDELIERTIRERVEAEISGDAGDPT